MDASPKTIDPTAKGASRIVADRSGFYLCVYTVVLGL
jgi:hypothetical protein